MRIEYRHNSPSESVVAARTIFHNLPWPISSNSASSVTDLFEARDRRRVAGSSRPCSTTIPPTEIRAQFAIQLEVCGSFVTIAGMTKQSAAIPFRRNAAEELEILFVTSRRRGRWVLPKGTVRGMLPHATAAREAFEEAGVLGMISQKPVGVYHQRKKNSAGDVEEFPVQAFPLFVNTILATWPEMELRQRQWMDIKQATEAVKTKKSVFY